MMDPRLAARVTSRRALRYDAGANPAIDRPAHVRSGSGLVRIGASFAVIQDDASFVAIIDPSGAVRDIPFPSANGVRLFDDGRGNKAAKLDLEACLVLDGTLVAFGSGSTDAREHIVRIRGAAGSSPSVEITALPTFYASLRAAREFSGAELNIEGATLDDDDIVLFQRGNGAGASVNATARVNARALMTHLEGCGPCPSLARIIRWDLGEVGGVRLTFTDAAVAPNGALAFLACAEDCPDATRDGPVTGLAIGYIDEGRREAKLALVMDEKGAPLLDKAEGLCFDTENTSRAWLVVDKDDPDAAAELLEIALGEGWRT